MSSTNRLIIKVILVAIGFSLVYFAVVSYVEPHAKRVTSGSMVPLLPIGATVFHSKSESYELGDMILFPADGNNLTAHRLIGFNDDGSYLTKGDANKAPDNWEKPVKASDVVGKVVFITPVSSPEYPAMLRQYYTSSHFWRSTSALMMVLLLVVFVALFAMSRLEEEEVETGETDR